MRGRVTLLHTFLLVILLSTSRSASPIEHIIVLMMENRSFDHLLGYLHLEHPEIDGLTGQESNPYSTTDPNSELQYVNKNGYDEGPDDPGHNWQDTAEQIYGYVIDPTKTGDPKMNGFAQNAIARRHVVDNPFSMFTIESAPIINTLALEFAVFDHWYCSVPGPTDPNRAYMMSGTSNGAITNFNGTLLGQQSYFDYLRVHGISWRAYYQDDPWAIMYFKDMHEAVNHRFVGTLDQFYEDLGNGNLAQFTLLQPRMTSRNGPPTWQHPDASVKEGERLYKAIYEALRASPFWQKLAFIITYDEHGGFYDHVAPPQEGVPSPDGVKASNGFAFDRLGIRVPTVLISPLVKAGTVVHKPSGPTPTSQYESTSIIATANKIFGINKHLYARDSWAGTF
jgi:phospholipase C